VFRREAKVDAYHAWWKCYRKRLRNWQIDVDGTFFLIVSNKKKIENIYIDLSLIENQNNGRQRRREHHGTRKIVFGSDTPTISKP
jgi:hypothetical protein